MQLYDDNDIADLEQAVQLLKRNQPALGGLPSYDTMPDQDLHHFLRVVSHSFYNSLWGWINSYARAAVAARRSEWTIVHRRGDTALRQAADAQALQLVKDNLVFLPLPLETYVRNLVAKELVRLVRESPSELSEPDQ